MNRHGISVDGSGIPGTSLLTYLRVVVVKTSGLYRSLVGRNFLIRNLLSRTIAGPGPTLNESNQGEDYFSGESRKVSRNRHVRSGKFILARIVFCFISCAGCIPYGDVIVSLL